MTESVDKKFFADCMAEVIDSTGTALGYIAAAIARCGDANNLAQALRAQIEAAKKLDPASQLPVRLATHALAALDAEVLLQRNPTKQ